MSDASAAGGRGAASVEYLALAGLIGLSIVIAIAALVASPPRRGDRELGEMLARRIACPPRYPVPCGRNPLALAYGFPLGKLVRYLAPVPAAVGGEVPVDFRHCRQASCAAPGGDPGLTASGRRATEFISVEDRRSATGPVRVTYWLYRPGAGWHGIVRAGGPSEIAAASSIRLNLDDNPALIPLETLPGRDHYLFPPGEEPPWRWSIVSRLYRSANLLIETVKPGVLSGARRPGWSARIDLVPETRVRSPHAQRSANARPALRRRSLCRRS